MEFLLLLAYSRDTFPPEFQYPMPITKTRSGMQVSLSVYFVYFAKLLSKHLLKLRRIYLLIFRSSCGGIKIMFLLLVLVLVFVVFDSDVVYFVLYSLHVRRQAM